MALDEKAIGDVFGEAGWATGYWQMAQWCL